MNSFDPISSVGKLPSALMDEADFLADRPLILIADDHPTNRKVLEIMLAKVARLIIVVHGREAVDAARAEALDVILMDMQMPVMDGVRATRQIREDEVADKRPRVPIVMLTAHSLEDDIELGREAGADSHMTKPVSMTQLHEAIETIIGARAE